MIFDTFLIKKKNNQKRISYLFAQLSIIYFFLFSKDGHIYYSINILNDFLESHSFIITSYANFRLSEYFIFIIKISQYLFLANEKKNEFYDRSRNENFVKMPINVTHKLNIAIQIFTIPPFFCEWYVKQKFKPLKKN